MSKLTRIWTQNFGNLHLDIALYHLLSEIFWKVKNFLERQKFSEKLEYFCPYCTRTKIFCIFLGELEIFCLVSSEKLWLFRNILTFQKIFDFSEKFWQQMITCIVINFNDPGATLTDMARPVIYCLSMPMNTSKESAISSIYLALLLPHIKFNGL